MFLSVASTRPFYYDSRRYWILRKSFGSVFSLLDYHHSLRGYAFPWLLRLDSDLLHPVTSDRDVVVRTLSLVLVPLLLSVLVPAISREISPATKLTVWRILLLNFLFFLFWRNDLLQPLSDLPALTLMAAGVLVLLRTRRVIAAVGAGIAFGLAVNFRNAYLLAAIAALALLVLLERRPKRLAARMGAITVGALLVLLPQIAINLKHYNRLSPLPVESSSLTKFQLMEGIQLDRYETNVGSGIPRFLRFENRALRAQVGPNRSTFDSLGEYGGFVWDHPVDVAATYARHLFNGVDVGFGGSYIEDVRDRGVVVPLLNYLVIALALASICTRWIRRGSARWTGRVTWFLAILIAACTPGILGAVEVRFLLPLHLTLLAACTLCASRADLPVSGPRRTAAAALVGAFVAVSFALSASTMGSLSARPLLVDGSPTPLLVDGLPTGNLSPPDDRRMIAARRIRATPTPNQPSVPCVPIGTSPLLAPESKTLLRAPDKDVDVRLRRYGLAWISIGRIAKGSTVLVDLPALGFASPWMLRAVGACRVLMQPAAKIVRPSPGARVKGVVPLLAAITNVYPTTVEFHLSGEGIADANLGAADFILYGWGLRWDSISVPNGTYSLTCVVVDSAGNSDVSTGVTVEVAN